MPTFCFHFGLVFHKVIRLKLLFCQCCWTSCWLSTCRPWQYSYNWIYCRPLSSEQSMSTPSHKHFGVHRHTLQQDAFKQTTVKLRQQQSHLECSKLVSTATNNSHIFNRQHSSYVIWIFSLILITGFC